MTAGADTRRLKYAVEGCINGIWGDEPNGADDLVVVRVADFDRERCSVDLGDSPTVRAVPQSARNRRLLRRGDLLIEKSGGGEQQPVGNVVLFNDDVPAVCSNFVARMPVTTGFDSRYLGYVFRALYTEGRNIPHVKQTSGIQNLDSESYLNERAWLPSLPTQERISSFLDEKTALIDALISDKERLLNALDEYLSSELTFAVTGRNLECPKARAHEAWLGEMPQHWRQTRISRVCQRVTDGAHISPDLSSPDFPFVSTVDIRDGSIGFGSCLRTAESSYSYLVRTGCKPEGGDVLFSKDGTIGRTALVPDNCPDFVVASSLVILSPIRSQVHPKFLEHWLNNSLLKQHIELQLAGAALRRISVEKVARLPLLLPPIEEQNRIVARMDGLAAKVKRLSNHVKEHVRLLREYRSSLISAAVTGQIDIGDERSWGEQRLRA